MGLINRHPGSAFVASKIVFHKLASSSLGTSSHKDVRTCTTAAVGKAWEHFPEFLTPIYEHQ